MRRILLHTASEFRKSNKLSTSDIALILHTALSRLVVWNADIEDERPQLLVVSVGIDEIPTRQLSVSPEFAVNDFQRGDSASKRDQTWNPGLGTAGTATRRRKAQGCRKKRCQAEKISSKLTP